MRQTSCIVYLTIDELFASQGRFIAGLDEFLAALDHAAIPCVWLSSQTRLQLDEPRRNLHHTHPFIAEDGCGVFLPEDYFHLRPEPSRQKAGRSATVRLGRFTCLPIAEQQPAASEALESLANETSVSVVPLRSLTPRELAQNTGLPSRQADYARQRDFDELFFFAGASDQHIEQFQAASRAQKAQLRRRGMLWSLAIGASVSQCVRQLSGLYDRALHRHAATVGIASSGSAPEGSSVFDRTILLTDKDEDQAHRDHSRTRRVMQVSLHTLDKWERLLKCVSQQK